MARKKGEQMELPGMVEGTVKIPELTRLAKNYVKARDERMADLEIEVELKERLIAAMEKHGIESYRSGGVVIQTTKRAVTVTVKALADGEPEDKAAESAA